MGYFTNNKIADVSEPQRISLTNNPNFVVFDLKQKQETNQAIDVRLSVGHTTFAPTLSDEKQEEALKEIAILEIEKPDKERSVFVGTYNKQKVNDNSFYVARCGEKHFADIALTEAQAQAITAENLKACLMKDSFFKNNCNISMLPLVLNSAQQILDESNTVVISAKGLGEKFNFKVLRFWELKATDQGNSSEQQEYTQTIPANYQIELDIYNNLGVFLGAGVEYSQGEYVTTLSKSYFGKSLWFNLNSLMGKQAKYSTHFLEAPKANKPWVDAGTISDYRFEARLFDGTSRRMFFMSDALYIINGYNYTLENSKLEQADEWGNSYILDFDQQFSQSSFAKVKPLSTRTKRTHVIGQTHYFNFLLKDNFHKVVLKPSPLPSYPQIGLRYKMYTQGGQYIGEYLDQIQQAKECSIVNTAQLSLDKFLPVYTNSTGVNKTVGRIDVYLCRWHKDDYYNINEAEVLVSTPLSFDILPQYLHSVNDFAFLNSMGGWDSTNFGGSSSSEFKTTASTIFKTLEPGFNQSSEIEKVNYKTVQEQYVVQTSPINLAVVNWLRELSTSPAVYELSTGRYVVVDDLTLKNNSKDDLFQVEMKYHYTDTFNSK